MIALIGHGGRFVWSSYDDIPSWFLLLVTVSSLSSVGIPSSSPIQPKVTITAQSKSQPDLSKPPPSKPQPDSVNDSETESEEIVLDESIVPKCMYRFCQMEGCTLSPCLTEG